jgi:diguanylate cyclase (GGDEF)-like protein/PAS domain S-box-containing protein
MGETAALTPRQGVNHLAFALGALAGLFGASLLYWVLGRAHPAARRWHAGVSAAQQSAFERWPTSAFVVNTSTLKILTANPAALRSLGYTLEEEVRRLSFTDVFSVEGLDPQMLMSRLLDATTGPPLEMHQRCKDGSQRNVEARCYPMSLDEQQVLGVAVHDISVRCEAETQLRERHQQLDHLAHHDQLTGLPNRLYLAAHLPGAIEEARKAGTAIAVLFLDLDRFKHVNDSRGHETGDKLLRTVAQRLRATVRSDDVVVRMGGDEFVVITRGVQPEQVSDSAQRINQALGAPMVIDGRTLVTTVSTGVAIYPRDGADMGELLRHSDTAMYQAKDRGRNNFQLFAPGMDRRIKERMAIESSLRTALSTQQLDVHYQPIVDIETNRVVSLEALLRWKHPNHGYVRPERFVKIAEEAGLIVPIGDFVLQRVIEDSARWRQDGGKPIPVSFNVSAVQLQRSNLVGLIERLTRRHGIEPSMLQIELTESAVFERREARGAEAAQDAVASLRDLGVRIAIDDFGTGYSSLSYLKSWRVDALKIDRSFVRDLVTDLSDLAIVSAIIAMARHLHIEVVAEGIEGWQQLEKLRQLGCNYAQGYLFARPAPADECVRYLQGERLDLSERLPALDLLESTISPERVRAARG